MPKTKTQRYAGHRAVICYPHEVSTVVEMLKDEAEWALRMQGRKGTRYRVIEDPHPRGRRGRKRVLNWIVPDPKAERMQCPPARYDIWSGSVVWVDATA